MEESRLLSSVERIVAKKKKRNIHWKQIQLCGNVSDSTLSHKHGIAHRNGILSITLKIALFLSFLQLHIFMESKLAKGI